MALVLLAQRTSCSTRSPPRSPDADVHTPPELAAHFAGMVSMVVVLLGVVLDGARKTSYRRQMGGTESKGVS